MSDIYISSDRFLPRAFIPLLRSLYAYFYRLFTVFLSCFYRPFLPSFDFIYLILRPTDQHYFVPIFRSLMVEGGRQRRLLVDTFRRLSRKEYTFVFHDQSRRSATSVRPASQTFNEHLAELPRAETITPPDPFKSCPLQSLLT